MDMLSWAQFLRDSSKNSNITPLEDCLEMIFFFSMKIFFEFLKGKLGRIDLLKQTLKFVKAEIWEIFSLDWGGGAILMQQSIDRFYAHSINTLKQYVNNDLFSSCVFVLCSAFYIWKPL